MTTPTNVRHLSVFIARPWREVYDYACVPEHFAHWASGLGGGMRRDGEAWIVTAPQGEVRVRFSAPNEFGVLDHVVTLPDTSQVHIPLRVLPHGEGAEVVLTLFRLPGMDDAAFARDADWVMRDLHALKSLIESKVRR